MKRDARFARPVAAEEAEQVPEVSGTDTPSLAAAKPSHHADPDGTKPDGAEAEDQDRAGDPADAAASAHTAAASPDALAANPDAADLAPRPRRTTITSFETRVLVRELQAIVGGHLDKAHQPRRDEVLLRFRAKEIGRLDLFYRRDGFFCLTTNRPENPTKPPGFAMAIRKHIAGGRVSRVEQVGFDRVVIIGIARRDGEYQIVFELFGDGNCILVRPDGNILVPLVPESWATRTVRSGAPYQPPPDRLDPWLLDEPTFVAHARAGNRDVVRAMAIECGIGGPMAEEVAARVGLAKKTAITDVSDEDLARCYQAWDALRKGAEAGTLQAGLVLEEGRPVDAVALDSAVRKRAVEKSGNRLEVRPMPSFSAALDALFLSGRKAEEQAVHVSAVQTEITKLDRQRAVQEAAVLKFEKEIGVKAREGELLYAHYQTIEAIREQILAARKQHDWKEIEARLKAGAAAGNEAASRVVRLEPDKGRVLLRLEDMDGVAHEVSIDIRIGITENADAAYKRSKTARAKLAGAVDALAGTMKRLQQAADVKDSADAAVEDAMQKEEEVLGAKRHHWFEGFRWCFAPDGALVVGGRDAGGNDRIVKKHLGDGDRYVHADVHGAPSIIVRSFDGAEVSQEALLTGGAMAVTCSRSFGRTGSGDAYWVTPPQVSKTPQAGEFLARGAFIVRGERQWMRKIPTQWSIGVVWLNKSGRVVPAPDPNDPDASELQGKVMGGPPAAVHAHADLWVDIEAGDEKVSDVAKRVARAFKADTDAVLRALPTGTLRITGSKGVRFSKEEQAA